MITGRYFELNMQRFYHVRDIVYNVFSKIVPSMQCTVHSDVQIFFNMTVFTMNLNMLALYVSRLELYPNREMFLMGDYDI